MAAMHDWQAPAQTTATSKLLVLHHVLVPLDGTDETKAALPVARVLAGLQGATVHVAYVGEHRRNPRETVKELGLSAEELQGVVLDQVTGEPAGALLQIARALPNTMIVMSVNTGAPAQEGCLGALAESVLGASPDRIVMVMPDDVREKWHIRRVLLAHDGTPTADIAIAPTADLAHRAGAEVIALHVAARGTTRPIEPGSLPAPRYIDQPQHEWPAWANEFVERMLALGGSLAAINFKLLVTGGQPGSEIAQFARDNQADLVVLPWDGSWNEHRVGATHVILRRSGCPVLLISTNPADSF
jgi:nucleotide-binding universal stress UspA family protein